MRAKPARRRNAFYARHNPIGGPSHWKSLVAQRRVRNRSIDSQEWVNHDAIAFAGRHLHSHCKIYWASVHRWTGDAGRRILWNMAWREGAGAGQKRRNGILSG